MKKVLAWAVALALVLSSFTMAFAGDTKTSKDFSDASDIYYTEAVDVMVATGVINGYPDGTFGPQKNVKRAEMAKMIAVMLNGGKDIGDQFKGSCTFADSKDHWAAGYIAYCSSTQPVIINGRSADVFDPEANVTGTEVAKMALCALGYDPQIQGYTGEQWAANVLRDADKVGLFEGLKDDFVPGNPCTREEAAQILFNCLQANMVEYDTTTSVQTGDVTVTVSSKVKDQNWKDNTILGVPVGGYDQKDVNRDNIKQLYEAVFGGDLQETDTDADESGRPAHEWEYDGDSVGVYTDAPDYEFFAEDSDTVYKALKAYDESLYKDFVNENAPSKETKTITSGNVYLNGMNIYRPQEGRPISFGPNTEDIVYKGDKVEMFKTGTADGKDSYRVVVTQYEPIVITEVDTDLDEEELDNDHTASLTFEYFYQEIDEQTEALVWASSTEPWYDDQIAGYDEETYVEDAVLAVAYNYNDGSILDSYVMEELASGTVTKVKGNKVTIDGTAYELTENYAPIDLEDIKSKHDFTLYDYNGYALASQNVDPADEVFYGIFIKGTTVKGDWEDTYKAKIFTAEGETTPYVVSSDCKINGTKLDENNPYNTTSLEGALIKYTFNEDEEIASIEQAKTNGYPRSGDPKAMKNGKLYGKAVDEEVVAFANIADPGDDDEWVVYDIDDLKDADEVVIPQYFFNDDDAFVAMEVGSLEAVTTELGFVTGITPVQNEDGDVWDIDAFVNGKEVTYTTKKGVSVDSLSKFALAKFTLDGTTAKAVELADCVGVDDVSAAFDGKDAVFYGPKGSTFAIPDGVFPVYAVGKNMLDVSIDEDENGHIADEQYVASNAVVYSFDAQANEMKASSFSKIKKGCAVILMKLDEDSDDWDTVIYSSNYTPYTPTPVDDQDTGL